MRRGLSLVVTSICSLPALASRRAGIAFAGQPPSLGLQRGKHLRRLVQHRLHVPDLRPVMGDALRLDGDALVSTISPPDIWSFYLETIPDILMTMHAAFIPLT